MDFIQNCRLRSFPFGVHLESRWSHGVQVESWSPGGVHLESVGEGKLHHFHKFEDLGDPNVSFHPMDFVTQMPIHHVRPLYAEETMLY
jgi:hypothetical protein